MKFEGRDVLFTAIVGSHNYNLNTDPRGREFKVFVAPSFDDLYLGNRFNKKLINSDASYSIYDIRILYYMLQRPSIEFIEVLYSRELDIHTNIKSTKISNLLKSLLPIRDSISRMNLFNLYDSCIESYLEKERHIDKGTVGTQNFVHSFGYDTESAMESIRVLKFIKRFADSKFNDFRGSLWYPTDDESRNYLLGIKRGVYCRKDITSEIEKALAEAVKCRPEYIACTLEEDTDQKITRTAKDIVRETLKTYC